MENLVYASAVESDKDLVANITDVAGDIRKMSGVFANFRNSLRRRCEAYIVASVHSSVLFCEQNACAIFYVWKLIHIEH